MPEVEFQVKQRVKTKPCTAFKNSRYGKITMIIDSPTFCLGSGLLSKAGESSYLVNFGGHASFVFSKSWIQPVNERKSG